MMTFDTANEDILELCNKDWLSTIDIEKMDHILLNCDAELRYFFAENLINAEPKESWHLLQVLTDDPDFLVRAEACQSLSVNSSKQSFDLLKKICCGDPNEVVRAYAIVSLGLILNEQTTDSIHEVVDALTLLKEKDNSLRVQLALCETLYRVCPNEEYIKEIVKCFDNPDYTIRCSALNHLEGMITGQNKERIKRHILQLQDVEDSQAVLSVIARLKKDLENI